MEIWVYKYRAVAEERRTQLRSNQLFNPSRDPDSTAMAPSVFGQANKEHLTPAHKVNTFFRKVS